MLSDEYVGLKSERDRDREVAEAEVQAVRRKCDGGVIADIQRDNRGVLRDAGVARRGPEPIEGRRLRQFPGQGVVATARSDEQDVDGVR